MLVGSHGVILMPAHLGLGAYSLQRVQGDMTLHPSSRDRAAPEQ